MRIQVLCHGGSHELANKRRARKLLLTGKLDKLAETDDDRIEILNNSIVNGWTGIYAMKGDKANAVKHYQEAQKVYKPWAKSLDAKIKALQK